MNVLLVAALALIMLEGAVLGGLYASGHWIVDPMGRPQLIDFFGFWIAGQFALDGNAVAIYDWRSLYDAQVAIRGSDTGRFIAFAYPPISLLWLAPLAALPYSVAFIAFVAITGGLYAYVLSAITARPSAAILALAVPPALASAVPGQNGFLTAALIGVVLLNLERRPVLSGVFLGLLSYKPQFGPLFPLILALSRRWAAFGAASVAVIALLLVCRLAFGWPVFPSFLNGGAIAMNALMIDGAVSSAKLQSVYGLARTLGAQNELAWAFHAPVALAATVGCAWLWSQRVSYPLKAATVATATVLVTPFVLTYDYLILIVALAFLWRADPWDRTEWAVIVVANTVLALAIVLPIPVGFLAPFLVGFLIARRVKGKEAVNLGLSLISPKWRQG